jgi:lipoate-protein ligase A
MPDPKTVGDPTSIKPLGVSHPMEPRRPTVSTPGVSEGVALPPLRRLDLSVGRPEAELALDEALLIEAEAAVDPTETLRLWAFDTPVVVLGRGSKLAVEVDLDHCRSAQIPVLRRCSGGAAIVAGPGCLMYSVVLSLTRRPELRRLDEAHAWVMTRLSAALRQQVPGVTWQGTCDLTLAGRKFSGNSLRIARDHLLYHGTILHAADLDQIDRCLLTPPRQPEYRGGRPHAEFVTNVPLDVSQLAEQLALEFGAVGGDWNYPAELTERLVRERYGDPAWHARH